jgi:hypothetical protein
MNYLKMLTTPANFKFTTATRVVVDGNSIYSTTGGSTIASLLSTKIQAQFGISATTYDKARSGASWLDMIADGSRVDEDFVGGARNILVCGETANATNTGGFTSLVRSGAQAWADCKAYVAARLDATPNLKVILCGTTPSNLGSTWNERVAEFESLAKENHRQSGIHAYVDFRTSASPAFNHTGDIEIFNEYVQHWADQWLHLTTSGKEVMVDQINLQGFLKLRF